MKDFSIEQLEDCIKAYNYAYREGNPQITDAEYDELVEELRSRDPENEFLQKPEPEPEEVFGKTVQLPERMLSTQKAYTVEALQKWANEVKRVSEMLGVHATIRVTPKLDGFAGYYDGKMLYTRGDGYKGTDITHVVERGLTVAACGKGEIVVNKEYFKTFLSDKFENTRNVIAAALKESELDPNVELAIQTGNISFEPFISLSDSNLLPDSVVENIEFLWERHVNNSGFDTDGLVFEALADEIRDEMGATNHHYRWQIAYKRNTEYHDVKVTGLTWQTAKTGRITPVVELEPTRISGVTVRRATGHHYGNVVSQGIRAGAVVRVCRSGQVIPYISEVVQRVAGIDLDHLYYCTSCGHPTEIQGDNLICPNTIGCTAQKAGMLEHFFKTLGNCDGFGPKVCEQLVEYGVKSVGEIYQHFSELEFEMAGFGEKTAVNLTSELNSSMQREIEDWRFLAAFGIPNFGVASCEKLLKTHRIENIFDLEAVHLEEIEGFGAKTADTVVEALRTIQEDFEKLLPRFNLKRTPIGTEATGVLSGKTVVFTGTMVSGGRKEMEAKAKELGAKVASSVNGKTDYLICGENVGATKTNAAREKGVTVLSEADYLKLIGM